MTDPSSSGTVHGPGIDLPKFPTSPSEEEAMLSSPPKQPLAIVSLLLSIASFPAAFLTFTVIPLAGDMYFPSWQGGLLLGTPLIAVAGIVAGFIAWNKRRRNGEPFSQG